MSLADSGPLPATLDFCIVWSTRTSALWFLIPYQLSLNSLYSLAQSKNIMLPQSVLGLMNFARLRSSETKHSFVLRCISPICFPFPPVCIEYNTLWMKSWHQWNQWRSSYWISRATSCYHTENSTAFFPYTIPRCCWCTGVDVSIPAFWRFLFQTWVIPNAWVIYAVHSFSDPGFCK